MKRQKTARLLVAKTSNPLSAQLLKFTGDGPSAQDFISLEKGDFLTHKKTGRNFIVMSKSYYDNLNERALIRELDGYKFRYKLTAIRKG